MNKTKVQDKPVMASRPKTIVSDRRKQPWDKYMFMPKSLMNRPFIDMSAFHKISEDGELSITQEIQLSNITGPNSEYNTENLFMEQKKLGRIKMLQTPNSQLRSTAYGTTSFNFNNFANNTSKAPSFTDRFNQSKQNDKRGDQPSLPLINIKRINSEKDGQVRSESGNRSQDMINAKKRFKQKGESRFNYHKPIFDNYEPIKYNMETGEWEMTNIVRNTRFINIERDLKDRMRVKGRFPIPDPIKKTKEHPKNDENVVLRADSLIESAYDSEKGEEWVKNEDFLIPGILSPLQSEISMHKVDLYSSTDEDEDEDNLLNDVTANSKRKDFLVPEDKHRRSSTKPVDPELLKDEIHTKSKDLLDTKTDKDASIFETNVDDKLISNNDFLNQNITSTDVVKTEGNELERNDTMASKEIKDEMQSTTPAVSQVQDNFNPDDELKLYFGSGKVATKFPFKIQNFKTLSAQSVENIFQKYCHELGVTPIKIYSYLVQGKILILQKYKINAGHARALAFVLPYFKDLEELTLNDNTLDDQSLAVIINATKFLANFSKLKIIK